jgi:hypothetical protein
MPDPTSTSLPSAVFLDTSILDGQNYNYQSTTLASFIPVAKQRSLKLLLPKPTEDEVRRHISKRSAEALEALAKARRQAPFLSKWKHFPPEATKHRTDWEVRRHAFQEWRAFVGRFDVVKLGYTGIDVAEIMSWYDHATPPFGEGKKRKEFPDALVIAILGAYAKEKNATIAVVSRDDGIRAACKRYTSFLYFQSLPELTELLLADSERIEALRKAITSDLEPLKRAIFSEAAQVDFQHEDDDLAVAESDIDGISLDTGDVRIVALGVRECTVTFDARVDSRHKVVWREWEDDRGEVVMGEWVEESFYVTGTAKLSLAPDSSKVVDVASIDSDVWSQYVTARPESRH